MRTKRLPVLNVQRVQKCFSLKFMFSSFIKCCVKKRSQLNYELNQAQQAKRKFEKESDLINILKSIKQAKLITSSIMNQ